MRHMITTTAAAEPITVLPRVNATTAMNALIEINIINKMFSNNLLFFERLTMRYPQKKQTSALTSTLFSHSGHFIVDIMAVPLTHY